MDKCLLLMGARVVIVPHEGLGVDNLPANAQLALVIVPHEGLGEGH